MGRKKQIWKPIRGFKGYYEVSTWGRVRSLGRFIKVGKQINWLAPKLKTPCFDGRYYHVVLYKNGKSKTIMIHRLVAIHFIKKPKKSMILEVNHKNGNKLQNNVENLEWVTKSENAIHSFVVLKRKPCITMLGRKGKLSPSSKRVIQYSLNGKKIGEYWGTFEAMRNTNIGYASIQNAARGISRTAGGFIWKYAKGHKVTRRKNKK